MPGLGKTKESMTEFYQTQNIGERGLISCTFSIEIWIFLTMEDLS